MQLKKFNSDFSNKIIVSCLKLSKMYSASVFLKDGLILFVLESLKLKAKKLKTQIVNA